MSSQKLMNHDRFIRKNFTNLDRAREYFDKNMPPALRSLVDLRTLVAQPESFVGDDWRLGSVDMLFSVNMVEGQGYLYTLVEHLSSPDPLLPFRMLKYMVGIWERHIQKSRSSGLKSEPRLPLIVPFVLYTGRRPFSHSLKFFDLFAPYQERAEDLLCSPMHLMDLSQTPDADLDTYPFLGPALSAAKYIHVIRAGDLDQVTVLLQKMKGQGDLVYVRDVVSYLVQAGHIEDKAFLLHAIDTTLTQEVTMNVIEQLHEEGRIQGLEQGLERGLEQGLEQGLQKGIERGVEKVAFNLLKWGTPLEVIAETTGLTPQHIQSLRRVA